MAEQTCSHCGQSGRRLEHVSAIAWLDYYRCDRCGEAWFSDGPAKIPAVKIVIAPEQPDRR